MIEDTHLDTMSDTKTKGTSPSPSKKTVIRNREEDHKGCSIIDDTHLVTMSEVETKGTSPPPSELNLQGGILVEFQVSVQS